jgi:hypothetical protein
MPAFWSSKPKAPPIITQAAPTSNPADDSSTQSFSTTTQGTRSSEENETTRSGQTTPKPSGLDNRIPAIPSVASAFYHPLMLKLLQSPTDTPRQTTSAGNEGLTEAPPPTPPPPGVAPIGPPRGKLSVRILQARNLKLNRPDVFNRVN